MKLATIIGISATIVLAFAILPAVSLAATFSATGTVTDVNGDPVSGAKVSLIDDSYNILAATMTDANGNFQFANGTIDGSSLVKAHVTFVHNGRNYSTRLENVNWIDVSQGTVSIPVNDTRLYDYPLSDHGYIWGTVMDSVTNGRGLDATVYLSGSHVRRSVMTEGVPGSFALEVPPGVYEIYAVHEAEDYRMVSNRTKITVEPSHRMLDSAPITLIADHRPASLPGDIKAVPLALALALGALLVIGGWVLLNRK